jgi:hypothetical protein
VAPCQKHKVHVFFVHGLDPFDLSNFQGLHDYIQSLGFIKTYYGWTYHGYFFDKQIRKLHEEEPDARLVLIGFSYGASMVRDLAHSLNAAGLAVDLVVYIDGVQSDKRPLRRPANAQRMINILAGSRSDRQMMTDAENHRHDNAGHFDTVAHPRTLQVLARALTDVARAVPIVLRVGHEPPPQLPAPTEAKKDWSFLRPDEYGHGMAGGKPTNAAFESPPATLRDKEILAEMEAQRKKDQP